MLPSPLICKKHTFPLFAEHGGRHEAARAREIELRGNKEGTHGPPRVLLGDQATETRGVYRRGTGLLSNLINPKLNLLRAALGLGIPANRDESPTRLCRTSC